MTRSDTQVFLHIGSFKTGSTAIQQMLKRGHAELHYLHYGRAAPKGVWASHAALGQRLQAAVGDPAELARLRSGVQDEIAGAEPPRVVLSCEYFSGGDFLRNGVAALRDMLGDLDVTVLYYVRDRVAHFESSFYQACKRGILSDSMTDYVDRYFIGTGVPYAAVRDRYAEVFGEPALRVFHYDRVGPDILGHFCAQLDVGPASLRPGRAENFSTSASASLLMQHVFDRLQGAGLTPDEPLRQALLRAAAELGDRSETVLAAGLLERLKQLYAGDAAEIGCTDFAAWPARLAARRQIGPEIVNRRLTELLHILLKG